MNKWFTETLPRLDGCALTMGNFDGMHLGHQKVLRELLQKASERNLTPVVLSYLEHPGHYIHFKHPVCILTPRNEKQNVLRQQGIKHVFFLNFTAESAHTSALDFFQEVIIESFHPKLFVFGYDSHFGYQREGDADFLRQYEKAYGYETVQIEPVYFGEEIISSSLIRQNLSDGRLDAANAMLGSPYRLYGTVTYGHKIGRTIGFPTVNLSLRDIEQLVPANGIYLSSLSVNGKQYFGLTNIGTSPTLKNMAQIEIETHILDFEGDVYDSEIRLDLLHYLREERKFNNVGELKNAIARDINTGKELIARMYKNA
jgi:riboflavin kinase / FMN adenylyltransferase